ncbi:hypothetical protein GCM10025865_22020 [Paraoerskovia sediminicola]|uniref:Uncharacterized protein n=1 Tax=Paraoerskovia sediminicola TaxID=1138587 RepID=A0ABM8G4C6_9CELL|nr:hypothetical protein GCM10025865_22020 [Paraoerskovia sediminicola]
MAGLDRARRRARHEVGAGAEQDEVGVGGEESVRLVGGEAVARQDGEGRSPRGAGRVRRLRCRADRHALLFEHADDGLGPRGLGLSAAYRTVETGAGNRATAVTTRSAASVMKIGSLALRHRPAARDRPVVPSPTTPSAVTCSPAGAARPAPAVAVA